MKWKFKITNSKTLNTILLLNFIILLVFSIFITLNTLIFSAVNEAMKDEKVNRDSLFLTDVYQGLYGDVTDCFAEYKYEADLEPYFTDPDSAGAIRGASDFLRRLKSLHDEQNECYLFSAASDTVVSGSGLLTKEAFSHNIKIRGGEALEDTLYSDGGIRVFQAVRSYNSQLTGMTLFVTAYRNTAMVISYTTQSLNEMLTAALSEPENEATVFLDNEVVCSSFATTVDKNAVISLKEADMSAYMPLTSPLHGTDFSIVYYKFTGGYDRVNRQIAIISIVFLGLLILIDLIIYYIIRRNFYNPLKTLLNRHTSHQAVTDGVNEFVLLERVVSDLQDKYDRTRITEESLQYENTFIRLLTGDANTKPSEVTAAYERFYLVKMVIDDGKEDNAACYQQFEKALSGQFAYQRIAVSDKLSYFILDAGSRGKMDFGMLTQANAFFLAGVSRKSSGTLETPLKQCEAAFACAGQEERVVYYKENLKDTGGASLSQETLAELFDRVTQGKLSGVEDCLDGIFQANRRVSIGQFKALCDCLADLLHVVSINTNTLIESFQDFYTIRETYNYDQLRTMIFGLYAQVTRRNQEKADNRILDIVKCVNEEYNTAISLQSLSDRFGLPVEQISKQFKKQTGVNFVNYKQQKRIEKAKEMLLEGKTVNEICQFVGFANPSTFIRLFEKAVGVTPGKYKQSLTGPETEEETRQEG